MIRVATEDVGCMFKAMGIICIIGAIYIVFSGGYFETKDILLYVGLGVGIFLLGRFIQNRHN